MNDDDVDDEEVRMLHVLLLLLLPPTFHRLWLALTRPDPFAELQQAEAFQDCRSSRPSPVEQVPKGAMEGESSNCKTHSTPRRNQLQKDNICAFELCVWLIRGLFS